MLQSVQSRTDWHLIATTKGTDSYNLGFQYLIILPIDSMWKVSNYLHSLSKYLYKKYSVLMMEKFSEFTLLETVSEIIVRLVGMGHYFQKIAICKNIQ